MLTWRIERQLYYDLCMVQTSEYFLIGILLLFCRYAMSFAANYLKTLYVKRSPELIKTIHIVSSAFKAALTWHNMLTLQV